MDLLFSGPGVGIRCKHVVVKTPVGQHCGTKSGFLLLFNKGQSKGLAR